MTKVTRIGGLSLAGQILLLQGVAMLVVVAVGLALAYVDARRDQEVAARDRAVAVAVTVADSPLVIAALRDRDPSVRLQPFAERVRRDTATDFVVVMSTEGIRYTHPVPSNIGGRFLGSISQARAGRVHTEHYTGTLGPSMRSVVPVRNGSAVVALVSVGITMQAVDRAVLASVPGIAAAAASVLLVGLVGSALITRRLRRQTHGMHAAELTRMYEYHDAVLHSVREGLLLLDRSGRVSLVNDEARRLLGLADSAVGRRVDDLGLPPGLAAALTTGEPLTDEIHLVHDRMLVVNRTRAISRDRDLGAVVTLRDHTELQAISGELSSTRDLAESLRSQNHESANRLHTVVSLIEMGRSEAAVEFATAELQLAQRLTDHVVSAVDDPVVSAMLLGKTAAAAERGVEFQIDPHTRVEDLVVEVGDLVTLLGNLVDNAIDATAGSDAPRRVHVLVVATSERLLVEVGDSGVGLSEDQQQHIFQRGWSTKTTLPPGRSELVGRGVGLALVVNLVRKYGGAISVGRSSLGGALFRLDVPARVGQPS